MPIALPPIKTRTLRRVARRYTRLDPQSQMHLVGAPDGQVTAAITQHVQEMPHSLHRIWLPWMMGEYTRLRRRLHLKIPESVTILLESTQSPRGWSELRSVNGWGGTHTIAIHPRLLRGEVDVVVVNDGTRLGMRRLCSDILLHNMVKLEVQLALGNNSIAVHHQDFVDRCNAIGRIKRLPPVTKRLRGDASSRTAAMWPLCVRGPDYYQGALMVENLPAQRHPTPSPMRRMLTVHRNLLQWLEGLAPPVLAPELPTQVAEYCRFIQQALLETRSGLRAIAEDVLPDAGAPITPSTGTALSADQPRELMAELSRRYSL